MGVGSTTQCVFHNVILQQLLITIIWYRVLPQGKSQFLFSVRAGCVVVWPIFSTSKMKAFCIYFYQGNITFKNIINLVLLIINLVEYLVINSYSERAKRLFFWGIQQPHFHSGYSPHLHGLPSWTKVWWRYHFDSLNYDIFNICLPHLYR